MVVDGRAIAGELKKRLQARRARLSRPPVLRVLSTSSDFATVQFLAIKKRFGEEIGVTVDLRHLPEGGDTKGCIEAVNEAAESADGVLVQLPLSPSVDTERVLDAIPALQDVDVLGREAFARFAVGTSAILPPVVGAVREILQRHEIQVAGKRVSIVGRGRNVGAPGAIWFAQQGADITTTDSSGELASITKDADIVLLGAGAPGILTPDMLKPGAVVLDAGTSEVGGATRGDADPACAQVASLFTPVPGGIGPITVAIIFENLLSLTKAP